MTTALAARLLALVMTVAAGWVVGRLRLLGSGDPARVLGNAALYLFIPALLLRTTARVDLGQLPWRTVLALFVPILLLLLLHYAWQVRQRIDKMDSPAAAGTRALAGSFGNTVQVGIPLASALFHEQGLAIHVTLVSLHALVLLTLTTALTEHALARAESSTSGAGRLGATLRATVRNTVVHPVVLPVLLGLTLNLAGLVLPQAVDEGLAMLAAGVVPLCLVLIGLSLAGDGLAGEWRPALRLCAIKLLLQPALVLLVAHAVFGLAGMPLAVVVMLAALPTGSNALIFAQRYRTLEAETSAAIVLSTLLFVASAALWLAVLARLGS